MDWNLVLGQATVNGLIIGLLYLLMAVGFTLVFGVMRMVNFAHGEFYMLGAFAAYVGSAHLGLPFLAAVALAAAAALLLGSLVEWLVLKPFRKDELNGMIATIGLAMLAPVLVDLAVQAGPWDYFALMLLALVTVSATFGDSVLRGLTSLAIGLMLGLIGIDKLTGQARMAFGVPTLLDGISITTLAVGLFAMGETLYVASRFTGVQEKIQAVRGSLWMTLDDWKRSWKPWLRGFCLGFPIGALPAGGAEVPTLLSYTLERKLTDRPEQFGHGAIEGVAGPEAANNAAAAGTMVPLLTLGLPTSATAAMMLAGFQQYGIVPGPLLFVSNTELVWGLIASFFIGNLMLLVLNLPLVGLWVQLLRIPQPFLYAGILVFAAMGTVAANPSSTELMLLVVFGVLGHVMRCWDYPVAPMIVGLILGPMAEGQFRRALQISLGDWFVFFKHPSSAILIALTLLALVAPLIFKGLRRFKTDDA